jgi:hypothetical protein
MLLDGGGISSRFGLLSVALFGTSGFVVVVGFDLIWLLLSS